MRIVVAVVGRPKHAGLAAAIGDYERRAARYWPIEVAEVREEPARAGGERAREREGERLRERVPPDPPPLARGRGGPSPGGSHTTNDRGPGRHHGVARRLTADASAPR